MIGPEIEQESFRIIRAELGPHPFGDDELSVVIRVIHATADFDFRDTLRFHPQAITSGVQALRRGCAVLTDVRMVEAGISASLLHTMGGQTHCLINAPDTVLAAHQDGITRAAAAIRELAPYLSGSVVAIGNAPTALFELIRLVQEKRVQPALVVGVPVGFVNAVESKQALLELDIPSITAVGRKGGSTVAAACVNALLRLASDRREGHE